MNKEEQTKYILVVDTNQYAGNFERALCAYCTGEIGQCEVGEEEAAIFNEEVAEDQNPFRDGVLEHRPDDSDSPCNRPCAIWPTPGWYNTGIGGHFRDDPSTDAAALAQHIKANIEYEETGLRQLQRVRTFSAEQQKRAGWTEEKLQAAEKKYAERIEKIKQETKVSHYPAYLSVALFFYDRPTQEQIDMVKARAAKFVEYKKNAVEKYDRENITITGFRLIEEKTTFTETVV